MSANGRKESVEVDGRTVRFTHPDKVLYEASGTTTADVLEYYTVVASALLEVRVASAGDPRALT